VNSQSGKDLNKSLKDSISLKEANSDPELVSTVNSQSGKDLNKSLKGSIGPQEANSDPELILEEDS
jgi:hypothetical protein